MSTFHLPIKGDLRSLISQLRSLEGSSIEQAWLTEHHGPQAIINNPLLLIAHLAAQLPSLRFGTAVLPVRSWDIGRMIEDLSMLETVASGRFCIGLGARPAGSQPMQDDALRLEDAVRRVKEVIGPARTLMSTVSYDGWVNAAEAGCGVIGSPPIFGDAFARNRRAYCSALSASDQPRIARSVYVLVSDTPRKVMTPSFFIDESELSKLSESPGQAPSNSEKRLSSRLIAGPADVVERSLRALFQSGTTDLMCCLDIPNVSSQVKRHTLEVLSDIATRLADPNPA
ncbi:MAG: LLM class flavin-dependent oxidoreductase [Pseudomonadota bacterium]